MLTACDKYKQLAPAQGGSFPHSELSRLISTRDSMQDLTSKTLVINFWATWCEPCREEMASLQQLSNALNEQHYIVLGVSVDEDTQLAREFLYQNNIRFENYLDQDQNLAQNILGIRAYPETFIVSPEGVIARRIVGQQDWNSPSMHRLLESIHKGEEAVGGQLNEMLDTTIKFQLGQG